MKLSCAQCQQIVNVAPGQSPPPWCVGCGADFKASESTTAASEAKLNAQQFAAEVLGLPQNSPRLRRCPSCKVGMPGQPDDPLPPWCPRCGSDVKSAATIAPPAPQPEGEIRAESQNEVVGSAEASFSREELPESQPLAAPTVAASDLLPPGSTLLSDVTHRPSELDSSNVGRDDRFALHNLIVGAGLGLWGLCMASGMGNSAQQEVLNSHNTLMTVIDVLQAVTLLNGVLLFVSGIGLRQQQRWGYRLATISALVSVLAGFMFVTAWQFLMQASRGGEVVEAVATMTFVRMNLDLLIGLLDGGGLLMLLWRRPGIPVASEESRSAWAGAY